MHLVDRREFSLSDWRYPFLNGAVSEPNETEVKHKKNWRHSEMGMVLIVMMMTTILFWALWDGKALNLHPYQTN